MVFEKKILEWLERCSDRNVLLIYSNSFEDIPKKRKAELKKKGYLNRKRENRKLELSEKGKKLLEEEV